MSRLPQEGDVIEVWQSNTLLESSWSTGETEAHYYIEIALADWVKPTGPLDLRIVHKVDGNVENEHTITVRSPIKNINIPTRLKENYIPPHILEKWHEILEGIDSLYDEDGS